MDEVSKYVGIIVTPLVFLLVLPSNMKFHNSVSFWLGASILFLFLVFSIARGILYYNKMNSINIFNDSVIETRRKIILVKRFFKSGQNINLFIIPIALIGISLWSGLDLLNSRILPFTILLLLFILLLNRINPKIFIFDRLKRIEDELTELEELVKRD
jgi:hypothetical protein